ncbi:MAG: serine/threonine protein kinase [Chloroflexales bacterium]|nr:serine/threonine protein kinase [Chloroflexales bacterium]
MTNPSASAPAAPLLFGRYRVHEALGDNRLATVYSTLDERLQRKVLLHLLRKDLVGQEHLHARFVDEANTSAQRSHPALLEVFDSGEVNGRPFMVTEYVSGRSLRDLGALTLEQALLYTRQVAGAVAACQALQSPQFPIGLPHPPISSSNILVVDEGQVKLIAGWSLPLAAVPLDLAHYRAPERAEGQPPSRAAAVYALGLLLYELITGKRLISGDDARSVAQAHLTTSLPPLLQVRPLFYMPALERLLVRSTARVPSQRFPDAAAFGDALDTLWRDLGATTQRLAVAPVRLPRRLPKPRQPMSVAALHPQPVLVDPPDADALQPVDRTVLRRQNLARGIAGWFIMLILVLAVALGSYAGASFIVDQMFSITLPQPSFPDFASFLPEWVPGGGEVLVVNSNVGLYIRNEPSLSETSIITVVPNGTPVTKVGGPVTADNVEWLQVRAEVDGERVVGWVSRRFLQAGS